MAQDALARGRIARSLVAEDARWLADVGLSATNATSAKAAAGLTMFGHMARVAYEGSKVAAAPDPHLGVPWVAKELTAGFGDIIARARHATKLLDDRKKSISDLEIELSVAAQEQTRKFTGNAVWFARWLEKDLSVVSLDGRLLLTSVALKLRFGFDTSEPSGADDPLSFLIAQQLGATLGPLTHMSGDHSAAGATLNLSRLADIRFDDRLLEKFINGRYNEGLPDSAKLLVMLVEGEINIAKDVLPVTAPGHAHSVLRAQFVTLVHAVRALRVVVDTYADGLTGEADAIRSLLYRPEINEIANGDGARSLRNQFVHYKVDSRVSDLDLEQPMFGLVEALWEGQTSSALKDRTQDTLERLAAAINA